MVMTWVILALLLYTSNVISLGGQTWNKQINQQMIPTKSLNQTWKLQKMTKYIVLYRPFDLFSSS